jgi:hypothetical protein
VVHHDIFILFLCCYYYYYYYYYYYLKNDKSSWFLENYLFCLLLIPILFLAIIYPFCTFNSFPAFFMFSSICHTIIIPSLFPSLLSLTASVNITQRLPYLCSWYNCQRWLQIMWRYAGRNVLQNVASRFFEITPVSKAVYVSLSAVLARPRPSIRDTRTL